MKVANSHFEDNWIGISAHRVGFAQIISNTFRVGSQLPLETPIIGDKANVGLYIFNSTGFKAENNSFDIFNGNGTESPVGILVSRSGSQYNEIYRNFFKNMHSSNLANFNNRGNTPDNGLQYLCNESTGINSFDIAVNSLGGSSAYGIAQKQGKITKAAANKFTNVPPQSQNFTHINNEGLFLNYYHTSIPIEIPTDFTVATVNLNPAQINISYCPEKLPTNSNGSLSGPERDQLKSDFYNGAISTEKAYAANSLVHHYLTDSLESNLDSVRNWLTNKGGLEAHFNIVDSWLGEADPVNAQTALDNIPVLFNLIGGELDEYNYFDTLKTMQINALTNDINERQMVLQNQSGLIQAAGAGDYIASGEAQALLNSVLGEMYPPIVVLPSNTPPQLLQQPNNGNTVIAGIQKSHRLMAVPNPAKGEAVFHYQLPDGETVGNISIASFDGRIIESIDLSSNRGQVAWLPEQGEDGVFFYTLWSGNKKLETKRLIILK